MKAKVLLKFIRKIDYTIDYENNGVPLTEYDEGFKAACNLLVGAVKIYDFSRIRCFFYRLWFRLRCKNGTENISNKTSGPGSSTRQGSLQGCRAAEGLANQSRGKGEGKAGTCVEAEQSKTPENKKAEIEKSQKGEVG